MAIPAIQIDELSTEERLDLLDRVWESLRIEPDAFPLTPAQRHDLDDRVKALDRDGPDGLTWEDVVREARGA
jgi:putative addiction module component (TIGR02574 family)